MSNIPAGLKYAKSHEWVKTESDGTVTIGITDFAQGSLGDLVFVETPAAGRKLGKDESCAVVESVKAASDVYAPIAGEVIANNAKLGDSPEILNNDPTHEGDRKSGVSGKSGALREELGGRRLIKKQ